MSCRNDDGVEVLVAVLLLVTMAIAEDMYIQSSTPCSLLPPKEQTAALQGSGQAGIQVRTANQEES
jgi:hypothetical protein